MAGELAGLTELLAGHLGQLLDREPGVPARAGVLETGVAAVIAALASKHAGPVLVLAAAPARAHALAEEIGMFIDGQPVVRLPERERLPYEFSPDAHGSGAARAHALSLLGRPERGIVVASWPAIAEHCAGPADALESINLAPGANIDPGQLMLRLEGLGYATVHWADGPGTASRRGGIVDVFPATGEHAWRIEFFGDSVESIRSVDTRSQRSTGRVERIELPPAATGTHAARVAARALAETLDPAGEDAEAVVEQLELVGGGERSTYEGFLEPLLHTTTAVDHLDPGCLVVYDDAESGAATLEAALQHDERARHELERRQSIPAGLPALRADPANIQDLGRRLATVYLDRFGGDSLGARRLPLRVAPSFAGKLRELGTQVAGWARAKKRVVVVSQQALRIAEILENDGVNADLRRRLTLAPEPGEVRLVPAAASGGFVADDLVVVTDAEIFGFRKRRRPLRSRTGVSADLVSTLEIGDYLVHADHGIARYAGLLRRQIDGIEKEYLELQYAEGDRLYVPADQLDAVARYVGPSDRAPTLTRLGSQDWARAKRRARQAVLEMAAELLDMYARRELARGHAFGPDTNWQMEAEAAFPFVETPEQMEAISAVKADMEAPRPMDRLICGDVGYGKTEVAVRGAFKAVGDGKQVAVLVPTTVLAEQHGSTFRERLAGFPVRIEVLSRFRSDAEQREIVKGIRDGSVDIVVGTHRLLQRDVEFKDLGLVVVDEEQRFGVSHKERLRQLKEGVDTLTLSATPIPRTLQMALSGIRDMSTIMTPPEERMPIETYVLGWDDEIVREAIDREIQRGGQIYFVHNRVQSIERMLRRLRELVPDASIAVGHGQMHEDQLERVMMEFAAGDHDVLVCTTIIESGLDIPNANTMIINNADMFGLSQLYQLRGRVGRGAHQAYAYLLYDRDRTMTEQGQKRLEAIFEATELGAGFQIALRDLEIRGAGNVLGTEQSGQIAAIGFEMYSKLVAEAVAVLRAARPGGAPAPPVVPTPVVDLPLSAHIPESYVEDIHDRLNVYQRIAGVQDAAAVATMSEELRDRFGPVPQAVEHLLYVALLKSLGKRSRVESIKTDEHMFHVRVRGGVPADMKMRVDGLGLKGLLIGPNQVRIDRTIHARDWMPLLVRILRAMAGASKERVE